MAMGDYLGNMFLGTAYGEDKGEANNNKGMEELWKIYRQAYNVKPIWNGKDWVMPKGAIQRFQMLLPLIQAQIRSGQGQGKQSGQNYGLLGGAAGGLIKELGNRGGELIGGSKGWGGLLDKIGGGIKGLWDSATSYEPSGSYDLSGGSPADFYQFDAQDAPMDINMPTVDPGDIGGDLTGLGGLDPSVFDNIDFTDYTDYADLADVGYW